MISPVLNKLPWKNGSQMNQVFMAFMIIIPTTSFGMILGWISPMQAVLQAADGPLGEPLTDTVISWMAAITFIVSIPVEFLMGYLADRMGRKFCILVTSFALVVCWLIKLVCLKPWMLVLARGIGGIACAGCFVITPLYIKEISDDSIRGALGSLLILSQNLGYLIVYVIGDLMEYKSVNWICFLIPTVHFLMFFVMPETPSYLIKKGKDEDALSVIAWLRCSSIADKTVVEELHHLQLEGRRSIASKASFVTLITDKTAFKALRISLVVMLAQECCGYLVVLMYASFIFEKAAASGAGLTLSPNKQAVVLGVVQLVGSVVASSVVEKTGRKLLLALTSFVTGIAMLILGVWFYLTTSDVWLPGWLPVSAMCLCIFCDAAGFQPTPYVIMTEMFSFRYRGMVTSFLIAACSCVDFLQTKFFDSISDAIGIHCTFGIFALLCFLGTIYTVLYVPETKNKTLEEIYEILGEPERRKKQMQLEERMEMERKEIRGCNTKISKHIPM